MSPDNVEADIQATYITDTRDLFCHLYIHGEGVYHLYMLDLDECNVNEADGQLIDFAGIYDVTKPILEYQADDVQNKALKQIHVRGSSRKENIDFNFKLMVLLLHGDMLYVWIKFYDE